MGAELRIPKATLDAAMSEANSAAASLHLFDADRLSEIKKARQATYGGDDGARHAIGTGLCSVSRKRPKLLTARLQSTSSARHSPVCSRISPLGAVFLPPEDRGRLDVPVTAVDGPGTRSLNFVCRA
jgi:hypothetical protein